MRIPGALTVRVLPSGGPVRDSVRVLYRHPQGERRLVLFVHGYQNDHDTACASYTTMLDLLADHNAQISALNAIYYFFWPGDRKFKPWSVLSYATQIPRAKESAKVLARFLARLQDPEGDRIEVAMVSHSLGGRVVLETVRELELLSRDPPRKVPRVVAVAMMAAAVPEAICRADSGVFGTTGIATEIVLFSKKDRALGWVFKAGQAAAFDAPGSPAVGKRGGPSNRWYPRARETRYGHGDYWKGDFSSEQISRLFGATGSRLLAEQPIVEWEKLPESALIEEPLPARRPGEPCSLHGRNSYGT